MYSLSHSEFNIGQTMTKKSLSAMGGNMIQAYLLYFDTQTIKIQADVLQLQNQTEEMLNHEINQTLQANGYEFYDYSDDIAILVDDRGFEKKLNPIFEITSTYGDVNHLAGRLLFVRNVESEFSVGIDSIKKEDIFNLRLNLDIRLIGMTKKEQV